MAEELVIAVPFWYHLPIPALSDPQPPTVRLVEWLVREHDKVHTGTDVAVIESDYGRYVVSANGKGFVRERLFPVGAEVETSNPIAVIACDGEDIPYGRSYSLARRVEPRTS